MNQSNVLLHTEFVLCLLLYEQVKHRTFDQISRSVEQRSEPSNDCALTSKMQMSIFISSPLSTAHLLVILN